MSAVPAPRFMTVGEYLAMEDASSEKHEFIGGQVYAMAGASFAHNQVVSNAFVDIGSFLKDKPCRIYGSDLKVHVKTVSDFVYPDLTIICDKAQFPENRKDIVTNPSIIIEVLSPQTEDHDYGKKFMLYRQIPSLQEYVLVSSMEPIIEKFTRDSSGAWVLTEYKNMETTIRLETIGYQTTLAEIYREVAFEIDETMRNKDRMRDWE